MTPSTADPIAITETTDRTRSAGGEAATAAGRGALGGAAVMMVSKCLSLLVALAATAIVARLVEPADYGLVAMVVSVTAFLSVPSDFGLSLVTVQKPRISQEQLSTLFWVNTGFGAALGLVTAALGPLLVRFYHDPRLLGITLIVALTFPAAALGVQHEALLKRHMLFGRLSLVRLLANGGGAAVTVLLAWWGLGYGALASQGLWIALFSTAGVWLCLRWRPGLPRRCPELRQMLGFGGSLTAHGMAGYFSNSLDKVLLGRFCGAYPLGLYVNAYTLMAKVLTVSGYSVGEAAIPAMSRAAHDPQQMRTTFRRMLQFTMLIGLPICLIGIIWAHAVVRTLLGPKWTQAEPLLRLLFLAALPRMIMACTGWVYIATGRPGRMLRWQLIWSMMTVTAFVAGLPCGAAGVAGAYAIACWVALVPAFLYCFRGTAFTRRDVLEPVVRPLLCALPAWIGGTVLPQLLAGGGHGTLAMVLHLAVFAALYAVGAGLLVPLAREAMDKTRRRLRRGPRQPENLEGVRT